MRCADAIVAWAFVVASVSSRTVPLRSLRVRGSWASASVCVCRRAQELVEAWDAGHPETLEGIHAGNRP